MVYCTKLGVSNVGGWGGLYDGEGLDRLCQKVRVDMYAVLGFRVEGPGFGVQGLGIQRIKAFPYNYLFGVQVSSTV